MKNKLLASAAILLLTGGSIAIAQDRGSTGGAGGQPSMQQGSGSSGSMQQSNPGMKGGAETKGGAEMKGGAAAEKPAGATTGQGSTETPRATQDKPASKAQGAQQDEKATPKGSAAEQKGSAGSQKGSTASDAKSGQSPAAADSKSQSTTTGQGAAGSSASLTQDQRTKITSSIKQTNVRAETNVNFNISVGTAVPRTVVLHALPSTVIEVYPQWRGYRFILVGGEIIIIEPASYKIVAVVAA